MLKTNNTKVMAYFKSIITQSLEEKDVENAMIQYNDNMNYEYNDKYLKMGLCQYTIEMNGGWGGLTCWYSEMRKDLQMALEETDEEANKYNDEDVARLYYILCERALFKVFNIHKNLYYNKHKKLYWRFNWDF